MERLSCRRVTHQQQVRVRAAGLLRSSGEGCGIQGREQRGVQEPSSAVRLGWQGRAVPARSSHLPHDEPGTQAPAARESPPSSPRGEGRAGASRCFHLFSFRLSKSWLPQPNHAGSGGTVSEGEHLQLPEACSVSDKAQLAGISGYFLPQCPGDGNAFLQF